MAFDTSTIGKAPQTGQTYVGQITSANAKKSKSSDNIMLTIGVDIISGESVGHTLWHRWMLVKPGDDRTTARWMARAGRDIQTILGEAPILPTEPGEETEHTKALVGKAFDFVVNVEEDDTYGTQYRIRRILGPIDPDDVSVDFDDFLAGDDELAVEEGAVL